MNNTQNIFNAITGYYGGAGMAFWRTMSRAELLESINSQADNFFFPVLDVEANAIADAVVAMRKRNRNNVAYDIHDGLARFADKMLAGRLVVSSASISLPSGLTPNQIMAMFEAGLIYSRDHADGGTVRYEVTDYARDLIDDRL